MKLINLPNIITSCNVMCGCLAIYYGLQGFVGYACLFILAGAFFDFFDGMAARALHISGPIGKELDSLADMVSFGIAPSVLAYQVYAWINDDNVYGFVGAAIIAIFSALRLAKFNCDERQHLSFIGLPTPSNAIFWIGLTYVVRINSVIDWIESNNAIATVLWGALVLIMSALLISEMPMFSLKLKPGHNGFAENKARYIFLGLAIALLIVSFGFGMIYLAAAPALVILLYIIMSVVDNKVFH